MFAHYAEVKALSPSLIAFALRHALVSFEEVLARTRAAATHEAASCASGLAPSLDDAQLMTLLGVLRERYLEVPVQLELAKRGHCAEALPVALRLFDDVWPHLAPGDRKTWASAAAEQLEALIDNPSTRTLALFDGAKVATAFLAPERQRDTVARLERAYEKENASGDYAELEYPYGQVHPGLAMARICASVGEIDKCLSYLEAREGECAFFLNAEELEDCAHIVDSVAADQRPALEARFLRWAQAPTEDEDPLVYAARWLTRPGRVQDAATAEAVRLVVSAATGAEALAELAMNAHAPRSFRDLARGRLVALAEGYATTLAAAPPVASGERNWEKHAFAVRQLEPAVTALCAKDAALGADQRTALASVARTWSRWIARETTANWVEHARIAIALANGSLEHMPEAAKRFDDEVRAGRSFIVDFEGWDRLFTPERALEVARSLL